jgi:hypothetical protein
MSIGKRGEHYVLYQLLSRNVEAYLATSFNQPDYDITVILDDRHIRRIQVKSTELQNDKTNNSFRIPENGYDYLVINAFENLSVSSYIMTREQAETIKGDHRELSVSRKRGGIFHVLPAYDEYLNMWESIV